MISTFFGKIRSRTIHFIFFLLLLGTSQYIAVLPQDHHAIRASLMPVRNIYDTSFYLNPPSTLKEAMRFEDAALLSEFRERLPDSLRTPNFASAVGIMRWIGRMYSNNQLSTSNWVPESPDAIYSYLIRYGLRGSCYNDAIFYSTFAQSIGLKVRLIEFAGSDGLGGYGHSVAAVWSDEYKKWVLIDQQECAVFYDSQSGIPLSAREFRNLILDNDDETVQRVVRVDQGPGFHLPEDRILALYRPAVNEYIVISNSDFFTAKHTSLPRRISSAIEGTEKYFGKYSVWVGRLFRAQFGDPFLRYRYVDHRSPDINYASWYYSYRIILLVWVISLAYFIFLSLRWLVRNDYFKRLPKAPEPVVEKQQEPVAL